MWEVLTFGDTPYTGMTGEEIAHEIRHNRFLERPNLCQSYQFDVMLSAWNISLEQRPTFEEISTLLRKTVKTNTEDIDHDEEDIFDYSNEIVKPHNV
ncbi:Tyrosine-protein kinase HTK16 [Holothuria leucospilota]|uniref:Tyrosine-protein kinase HTK16 n=1 Tax=Holothuria leucospilota TaxID=206669 RepID=A0A9Q1HGR3_HOLLE|nr:Tyrosine-protein kinase HTK16 [Holothuria leucospilota]